MSPKEIEKVGVLGAGLMGSGIVQVCAQAGYEVVAREVEEKYWKKGFERVGGFLQKAVEKEKMTAADREAVLGRMTGTTRIEDLAGCDLVGRFIAHRSGHRLNAELIKMLLPEGRRVAARRRSA